MRCQVSGVELNGRVGEHHAKIRDGSVTDGGNTGMSGYTIIETESMETALEAARACPFLDIGGTLEVSELGEMPAQKQS